MPRKAHRSPRGEGFWRLTLLSVLGLSAVVALPGKSPVDAAETGFRVIVHPEVQGTRIPRGVLSAIFLREALRWGDGSAVAPVDQSMKSQVRASFSDAILETPLEGLTSLWHKRMIKGIAPPPVKSTDEEVIAYVARTRGAIGYVSPATELPPSVRAVDIID